MGQTEPNVIESSAGGAPGAAGIGIGGVRAGAAAAGVPALMGNSRGRIGRAAGTYERL